VQRAALLLHVTDATSATAAEQMAQVEKVLRELDCASKQQLHVMNKIDMLGIEQRQSLVDDESTVHISAAKGINLHGLLDAIDQKLQDDPIVRVSLRIPQSEGKILSTLEAKSRILKREYADGAVELTADLPQSLARRLEKFVAR
jgi:50S ribosomal subunit-associated GTPase HflX